MALLDELKQQAESLKRQEQLGQLEKSASFQAVQAALKEASRYLTDLASSLNVVRPLVSRYYYIDASTKLDNLTQAEYLVRERRKTVNNKDFFEEVVLHLRCVGRQSLVLEKDGEVVERMREYLWGYNLRFDVREIKNERGYAERAIFEVHPDVPVAIRIIGDWSTGQIRLVMRNLEKLGEIEYLYDAPEFNQELLEEFAKLLLGKPNNFRNLGKHQEMMRSTPRPRDAAELARPQPPAAATPPEAPQDDTEARKGLLGGLKSLLKR